MSSIKPPGGKPPIEGGDAAARSESAEATGPGFGEAVEKAREASAAGAAEQAAPSASAEPIAELARAIDRGELEIEQALEQLLELALTGVEGQLGAAERSELLGVLRSALEQDPALAELKARLGS